MTTTSTSSPLIRAAAHEAAADRSSLTRKLVFKVLRALKLGGVRVVEHGEVMDFGARSQGLPFPTIYVRDSRFYRAVAFGGSVGAGESYMEGWWECDDLAGLIRTFVINQSALDSVDSGFARIAAPAYWIARLLSRNTIAGSKRNIAAHYDLSNEFFALWLDPSMMYSSAIYERPEMTLEQAQNFRLNLIGRKLALKPEDHLLEIGTGWGSMAITAARDFGCRVTTTTISARQAEYARAAVAKAGLGDRVHVIERDYRDLPRVYGERSFTKLVSLEMIEAVGADHLDEYASVCAKMLVPHGRALIQAILIADRRYRDALRTPDFIQKHIFPGSFIPSLEAIGCATAKTDLTLSHAAEFGTHYARTLREWRERFNAQSDRVRGLGFDDRFMRMWNFYLAYCEGAFAERHISVAHLVYRKPMDRTSESGFEAVRTA
ncbi:MAG: class I SAM-dependent methyltransferase [Phycisphaerales bacterium]|jgi:cyclopropane-fatty-acyl-phospholipid synthase